MLLFREPAGLAAMTFIGPVYPELPFFDTPTEFWAHDQVRRHRHRFDRSWEDKDIFHEIFCCYLKMLNRYPARSCAERYPQLVAKKDLWDAVTDVQMSLLKVIVANRLNDLTNKKKRPARLITQVKNQDGEEADILARLADTQTDGVEAWMIASKYDSISPELQALIESPISNEARRSRTFPDGTRETTEQRLVRIATFKRRGMVIKVPLRQQLEQLVSAG